MRGKILLLLSFLFVVFMIPVSAETADPIPIRIVHTGNLRGAYAHSETAVGFTQLKTIADVEGADLLLDSGNAFCGSAAGSLNNGSSMAAFFDAAGYDAVAVGTEDLNQGVDALSNLDDTHAFTAIASNLTDAKTHEAVFTPYLVKTIDRYGKQIKIGVMSLTDPMLYPQIQTDKVTSLTMEPLLEQAKRTVAQLKEIEDCQIIVAMMDADHSKTAVNTAEKLADTVDGIDVILDCSEDESITTEKNTLIVRMGTDFNTMGQTVISLDPEDLSVISRDAQLFSAERAALYQENRDMRDVIEKEADALLAAEKTVVGQTDTMLNGSAMVTYMTQTNLGQLVAQAYQRETGADIGMEVSGAIRDSIVPGEITLGSLYAVLPYNTPVVTKVISGGDLKALLEANIDRMLMNRQAVSDGKDAWPEGAGGAFLQIYGVNISYDSEKKAGSRIINADIGGAPLDWDASYTVAMSNRVAQSPGFQMLADKPVEKGYGDSIHLLSTFLKRKPAIAQTALTDVAESSIPQSDTAIPQEASLAESLGEEIIRLPAEDLDVSQAFVDSIGDNLPMLLGVLVFLFVGGVIYQNQQR